MIQIKSKTRSYNVNFPSSIYELTPIVFNELTNNINLPKHYCIVALAFKTNIFEFCTAMNNKRNTNIDVTPIMAKISNEDSNDINSSVGDIIITDRSSLERGNHINIKTVINSNSARNYFNSDPDLVKDIITKSNVNIGKNIETNEIISAKHKVDIIILEFKILPVNDIVASIPINKNIQDPFIIFNNENI